MSEFFITPTNVDFLKSIFRNPVTGKWTIPILTFNTVYPNPFYKDIDPLNDDPNYQKSVINYIYIKLTERWLYQDPVFRKLLRYFDVTKNGTEGQIALIEDIDSIKESDIETNELRDKYRKYIFKYIEKYFITKNFVGKVLKEYIRRTHTKWYDIFNNTDVIKDLFAYKLKKSIISTIYELKDKKDNE